MSFTIQEENDFATHVSLLENYECFMEYQLQSTEVQHVCMYKEKTSPKQIILQESTDSWDLSRDILICIFRNKKLLL